MWQHIHRLQIFLCPPGRDPKTKIGLEQKGFFLVFRTERYFAANLVCIFTLVIIILLHLPNPGQNQALALTLIEGDLKQHKLQTNWRNLHLFTVLGLDKKLVHAYTKKKLNECWNKLE